MPEQIKLLKFSSKMIKYKLSISLCLVVIGNRCSSMIMSRFISSTQTNRDVLDLYYDFLLSNSSYDEQPILADKVRSAAQCCLWCLLSSNCDGFTYSTGKQLCHLGSSSKNRSVSNSFRRNIDCPSNFVYLSSYNKCYKWIVGSLSWSEARKKCNELNSHPLMIENLLELQAVQALSSLHKDVLGVNQSKCLDYYKLTWTAGTMVQPNQLPFVWKPFKMKDGSEPHLPIGLYNWAKGQPDNYLSSEFCLHLRLDLTYNDLVCNNTMCVICEIDV